MLDDLSDGVRHAAVVVSAVEVRIVISALQLQARLEHFGGHIERRCSEVSKTACSKVGDRRIDAHVQHTPLCELVCAEEDQRACKRAQKCWKSSTI